MLLLLPQELTFKALISGYLAFSVVVYSSLSSFVKSQGLHA